MWKTKYQNWHFSSFFLKLLYSSFLGCRTNKHLTRFFDFVTGSVILCFLPNYCQNRPKIEFLPSSQFPSRSWWLCRLSSEKLSPYPPHWRKNCSPWLKASWEVHLTPVRRFVTIKNFSKLLQFETKWNFTTTFRRHKDCGENKNGYIGLAYQIISSWSW